MNQDHLARLNSNEMGLSRLNRDASLVAIGVVAGALIAKRMLSRRRPPIRAPGVKAWRMSKWVSYGGIIRTQGICGDLTKCHESSTATQTAEALAKLDAILEDAGVTRGHLIAITIFIADISQANFDEMNGVYDAWIDPNNKPTRLCVQAQIGHGAAVEIRAEAYCEG